jgi:hypothetical protein
MYLKGTLCDSTSRVDVDHPTFRSRILRALPGRLLVNPGFVSMMKEIGQRVDFGNLVISVDNATFDYPSMVALVR